MFESERERSLCKVRMCLTASTTSPVPASPFVRIMLAPASNSAQARNGFENVSELLRRSKCNAMAKVWQCLRQLGAKPHQGCGIRTSSIAFMRIQGRNMPQHAATCRSNVHLERARRSFHDVEPRVNSVRFSLSHPISVSSQRM